MFDIVFKREDNIFNYRVVAVITHEKHILVHQQGGDPFWTLPGGRCGFGESSEVALHRELIEELGEELTIKRCLWVAENFFLYNQHRYHELSFYYLVELGKHSNLFNSKDFIGIEAPHKIHFKWVEIDELKSMEIKPSFLYEKIHSLPHSVEHIIYDELSRLSN